METPSTPPSAAPVPNNPAPASNNIELWGRTRLGILSVGIIVLTIVGRTCGKHHEVPGQPVKIDHPSQVIINDKKQNGSNGIRNAGGTKSRDSVDKRYIPPEGSVTITPRDPTKTIDDLVKIHYQEIGWTFEPGIEFSGNIYYSFGVDAKLFYAYRFGAGAGIVGGSNVLTAVSPNVFLSYRLDQIYLDNTELIVTYVPAAKISYGVGLRINL